MKDDFIKFAPLFAGMTPAEQTVLSAGFVEGQCSAKAVLLKAGDTGEALYLIGQGFVALSTQSGQNLATLGPGSIIGEESLFRGKTQDVNATALSDLSFWKLSDRNLRDMILVHPKVGLKLSQNFGTLLAQMQDYLIRQLSDTPELGRLPNHTLKAIAAVLQPKEVKTKSHIYRAGDPPAGLFLLESGEVELQAAESGAKLGMNGKESERQHEGDLFGEFALLTNKPYLHNAIARKDTMVWTISPEDFQTVSSHHPGLRRSLARNARSRLSKGDQAQAVLRLAQMPLFTEIPPQTMQIIAQHLVLQHVPAGERVYMMGEAGDALYLIEDGEVELTAENANGVVEELARVGADGFFGEMSLLTGQIRVEDATAIRNTNLWILYKSDLDELGHHYPEIGKALSLGIATRLSQEEQDDDLERFRSFELFSDLDETELRQVIEFLNPTRYRGGEQIYRATSPADMLFLLEEGHVRIQSLSGGSWLLGPGEAFGERALLTNQPHNASAVAETDVDLWSLSKTDFDMLMNRYPSLAISMSRILSQRLAQINLDATEMADGMATAEFDDFEEDGVTPINVPSRRQRSAQNQQGSGTDRPRERVGFGPWFANLTTFGKVRLAVLILLLIWLLGIAAPAALLTLLQGTSVASGADLSSRSSVLNAISAVYAIGSYELSSQNRELAQVLAMADSLAPATMTPTPTATLTPIPTQTPLPTSTSTQTPIPTSTPALAPQVAYVPPTATPEPVVQAAAVSRAWDPRLDRLGVFVEDAPVEPGQPYWRLIEAKWWNEQESGGKHHIYVEVLDENGSRVTGQPVTVFWGDGNDSKPTEDRAPPDYAFNYQMYAAGNAYHVKIEGLPSDTLRGAGMGDIERPRYGIHTSFLLTFQKSTR